MTGYQLMILGLSDFDEKDAPCACTHLNGPHKAGKFDAGLQEEGRSWHVAGKPIEEGLKLVVEHVHAVGAYDGAYAFSQGS